PPRPVRLAIEQPADGALVGGEPRAFVAGRALATRQEGVAADVVFAIDVSGSAAAPSGVDVNGNGVVAVPREVARDDGLFALGASDPGDSVLAAEIAAVRRFVARLDRRHTRVALVTFAGELLEAGAIGDDPAVTEIALTQRYEDLHRALDRVLARGARGATHMAAGVDRAVGELTGARGAYSEPDPGAERIVVFLTDGIPTLPFAGDDAGNLRAVLDAAARARLAGVRVLTYGVGDRALAGPLALVDLAAITDGVFTPVRDPARLSDLFDETDLADVTSIAVRNATTGEPALAFERGADGSFGALLPLRAGRNEIEVTASAPGVPGATRRIALEWAPDAPAPALPPDFAPLANRVLEIHLAGLRRARIGGEQAGVEALRKRLRVEIERERAGAEARAAKQRKELEVRIEKAAPAAAP
ncbi:MAG: hypothetical protein DCC71_18575, partial [Proteobacteria bacterium]